MADPVTPEGSPLSYYSDYRRALYAPMGAGNTTPEEMQYRMVLMEKRADLASKAVSAKQEAFESFSTFQTSLVQAEANVFGTLAKFAQARGTAAGAVASSYQVFGGYFDKLAASGVDATNGNVVKKVLKVTGEGQNPFSVGLHSGNALADMKDRAAATNNPEAALAEELRKFIQPTDSQMVKDSQFNLQSMKGDEKVDTAVAILSTRAGLLLDSVSGDPAAEAAMERVLYGDPDTSDPGLMVRNQRNLGIEPEAIEARRVSRKAALEKIGDTEKMFQMLDDIGVPQSEYLDVKEKLNDLGDSWGTPQAYASGMFAMESPREITEAIGVIDREISRIDDKTDPWMSARNSVIRAVGSNAFYMWMGSMGFKGPHSVDRAALYAARHVPEMRMWKAAVEKDPSLADFSENRGFKKTRLALNDMGFKTSAIARATGVTAFQRHQQLKDEAAKEPAPTVMEPVLSPQELAEQYGAVTAEPTPEPDATIDEEVPVEEIKPGEYDRKEPVAVTAGMSPAEMAEAEAEIRGDQTRMYVEGPWGYMQRPDGSIQIWKAPEDRQSAIGLYQKGSEIWEAINGHIASGDAQPIGASSVVPQEATTPPVTADPDEAAFQQSMQELHSTEAAKDEDTKLRVADLQRQREATKDPAEVQRLEKQLDVLDPDGTIRLAPTPTSGMPEDSGAPAPTTEKKQSQNIGRTKATRPPDGTEGGQVHPVAGAQTAPPSGGDPVQSDLNAGLKKQMAERRILQEQLNQLPAGSAGAKEMQYQINIRTQDLDPQTRLATLIGRRRHGDTTVTDDEIMKLKQQIIATQAPPPGV